jgi:Ni,Fe-hydrogenase III large subunit
MSWPVLKHAIIGNIVPDFPLINESFNLARSGHDLQGRHVLKALRQITSAPPMAGGRTAAK